MSFISELVEEIKNRKVILTKLTETKKSFSKTFLEDLREIGLSRNIGNYLYFEDGFPFQTFINFYKYIISESVIIFRDNKMTFTDMDTIRMTLSYIEFPFSSKDFKSFLEGS